MKRFLPVTLAGIACSAAAFAQTQSTVPTPVANPLPAVAPGIHTPAAGGGTLIYDNGDPDYINGYSNTTAAPLGFRRTLLDDFTVPAATTWDVGCIEWTHVWNSVPVGSGTGMELEIFKDVGGTPDLLSSVTGGLVNVCAYTEVHTGNIVFSRPEALSSATFDTVSLGAGTYWWEATIVGPEYNFWLTAPVQGNECWVNYSDVGGLFSGTARFGVASDLAWRLYEGDCDTDRVILYCNPGDGHPQNTATLSVSGNVLDSPDIDVCMTGGPPGQAAYLLVGSQNGIVPAPPGAKGDLCIVGGFIGRYQADIGTLDATGGICVNLRTNATTANCNIDYTIPNTNCAQQYMAGETWYFQFWHRQPQGSPSTFSEAACVTFK